MGDDGRISRKVARRLALAGCVAAGEEAEELVAAAPSDLVLDEWLVRREQGEPLAWITGRIVFAGQTLRIGRGLYVPRLQSEELAGRAAALLPRGGRAIDFCTGAGAIAAHMQATVPGARVLGVDLDLTAARCARSNGIRVIVGDLDGPLRAGDPGVDVVTAVAPYVPTAEMRFLPADVTRYEPLHALDGGDDGLAVVRRVIAASSRLLRLGGALLLEVGGRQEQAVRMELERAGFVEANSWYDEDGDLRGVVARLRGPADG